RVRAVRLIAVGLWKRRFSWNETAVNFISTDMQKPKRIFLEGLQAIPVMPGRLKKRESPHHVGLNKIPRAMDRTINMALCSKVQNCTRLVTFQQPIDKRSV